MPSKIILILIVAALSGSYFVFLWLYSASQVGKQTDEEIEEDLID